jgi:hypothetical protein
MACANPNESDMQDGAPAPARRPLFLPTSTAAAPHSAAAKIPKF